MATLTLLDLVFAALSVALWAVALPAIRSTTLLAAWIWTGAAVLAIAGVTLANDFGLIIGDGLRFAMAALAICPIVAVLGAKRPQHHIWQWIVVSLWGVMALPAIEAWLYDKELQVGTVRGWFLLALIGVTLANYLSTRFWIAAMLTVVVQWLTLSRYMPWSSMISPSSAIALPLAAAALGAAWWAAFQVPRSGAPIERLWRDFRDLYGLAWAMRVAERFNSAAVAENSSLRLGWRGVYRADSPKETSTEQDQAEALRRLRPWLRRFVSPAWIAARLNTDNQCELSSTVDETSSCRGAASR